MPDKPGKYTHPSIVALMDLASPGESPEDVIRRRAREIISKHSHLWLGPPFCPFALADLEGVRVEEAPIDIRSDGRIFPKGDEVWIQYAKGQTPERRHFTICHELGHTLFPDCYQRIRNRTKTEKEEWEFENLCNIAASEFLFPIESFLQHVGNRLPNANEIISLASRYAASVDATSRRLINVANPPACVAFARYQEPTGKRKTSLVIQYAVSNERFSYNIHPNLRINTKSVANAAYSGQRPHSCTRENWNIAGKWASLRVEAIPLPKFAAKEASDLALVLYH